MLQQLVDKCENGTYATALQAVEGIATPAIREVKPVAAYTGVLQLGDFENDMSTSVAIDVVRYPKTKIARAPSASKFVQTSGPQASNG
jgi:ATP-dependent DNA helicase 2 subunit 2